MRRHGLPLVRSVLGVLVALVLLCTAGLTPAGAAPVREQATLGLPRTVSLPTSPMGPGPTAAPFADMAAYALRTDVRAWAWGSNGFGELGSSTTTNSSVPLRVSRING